MKYQKLELPAGDGQLIVVFRNHEDAIEADMGGLADAVAQDAEQRLRDGWRLSSLAPTSTGLSGQSSLLASSSGQHATEVALIAVYSRQPA
jgi:hypothetical protein